VEALRTGRFTHPDGRQEVLGDVNLGLPRAALLAYLCRRCRTGLSIEVGFGMGSSAGIILAMRTHLGQAFEHLIFDPYGLKDGMGNLVQSFLQSEYGDHFQRVMKPSEIGLGQLLSDRGHGAAGLVFIDGGHHFENVMVDFCLADKLCSVGGYIVFDDAWFPAIESAINYIKTNRPDYAVSHLPVQNAAVLTRIGLDRRSWDSFKPFAVPDRSDWTRSMCTPVPATDPTSAA
jgi:hypothetical protein